MPWGDESFGDGGSFAVPLDGVPATDPVEAMVEEILGVLAALSDALGGKVELTDGGTTGSVDALTVWNGLLVAGGNFAGSGVDIASWSGSAWQLIGQALLLPLIALTVWNGTLVAVYANGTTPVIRAFQCSSEILFRGRILLAMLTVL